MRSPNPEPGFQVAAFRCGWFPVGESEQAEDFDIALETGLRLGEEHGDVVIRIVDQATDTVANFYPHEGELVSL